MITFPLAESARLLGIHPKTLHHWLKKANIPFTTHPTDARIKCLTEDHLHQLATLHGRPLQFPASTSSAGEGANASPVCSSLPLLPQQLDLIQKLASLEAQIATLQELLTQLVLALLQEREGKVERRLTVVEAIAAELVGKPLSSSSHPPSEASPSECVLTEAVMQALRLNPAEQRARSRLPALVEHTADGTYVIISGLEGELSFSPDGNIHFSDHWGERERETGQISL